MSVELTLSERLARQIEAGGPISVAHYMAEANQHYYGTRDPMGAAGDFTTAPEISQMFGELIGLCLADIWMRSGSRPAAHYVELGPGRGTLASDALRAMASVTFHPRVHFVETSPSLRERQGALIPNVAHHDSVSSLPEQGPLLVVANEFFDALPVRQLVRVGSEWRERVVVRPDPDQPDRFAPMAGYRRVESGIPAMAADAPEGAILEMPLAGSAIALELAHRIAKQGGAAIVIDYGYEGPATGDTLQAVRAHRYADPFLEPGESDLTTHVDFTMIGNMARQAGLRVTRTVGQGAFLRQLGIDARADQLSRTTPARAEEVEAARRRLTDDDAMGTLFKAMAWVHPDWADPAGFEG
ncbi:SAM-dependent methyltransferase [Sphingobium indicum]|uniref:ATP synthase subunit beta n=2 Tax=Sphingobium indicum TaxID=332055 RepID=A0A1L5BN93_SPHIB|nr:SAM-dependent methyltransferase [Sphingobium indicum]APL94242.1 ATP synthase subunit beta [Sphingobium indicum B90A]KEY97932.1 ATP synthase subunit beta [Sphingomonas sp. BHC-A]NYI21211.1 SAM-dependent MidA family methyltransferase [Sphingobium indicum]RYM03985.1 SAM-dependent methyltransferase [Sphingobium indicum]